MGTKNHGPGITLRTMITYWNSAIINYILSSDIKPTDSILAFGETSLGLLLECNLSLVLNANESEISAEKAIKISTLVFIIVFFI